MENFYKTHLFNPKGKLLKKATVYSFICFSFFSFIFTACDAPRENPLDPLNDANSELGVIEGTIQTFSIPYSPVEDVTVFWEPGGKTVKTDSNGSFNFRFVEPIDGNLIIEKEGFRTDTLSISWGNSKKISRQINLNKQPDLEDVSIFTVVESLVSGQTESSLHVELKINDKDNDIDSVIIQNRETGVKKALNYDIINKTYVIVLSLSELRITNIDNLIGQIFEFVVIDGNGREHIIGSSSVTRVIRTPANIISPVNNAVTGNSPQFTWERYITGFSYTYTLELYSADPVNPQLIFRVTEIPESITSYKMPNTLPAGEYLWVIWVVDTFNNRVRSKPASFTVQ